MIIPAFQSASHLDRCLTALSVSSHAPSQILVIDDGSTDGGGEIASRLGATVLRVSNGPRGPAAARNLGASDARGEILMFLDADVAVHRDTLARISDSLAANPDVAAVFGSYDDTPAHPGTLSQYRNLLHHFVHQNGRREASTFWAGCGAIRRDVFIEIGGFDERFTRPSVEDIELGSRLRRAGHRILLCRDIQATHLKRWTFTQIVRSDIADRAIPWTRLIVNEGKVPEDLNTSIAHRLSAAVAWIMVGAMCAAIAWPSALWLALAAAIVLFAFNRRLYLFFVQKRGLTFTILAAAMHTLYLLYSSATFGLVGGTAVLSRVWRVSSG